METFKLAAITSIWIFVGTMALNIIDIAKDVNSIKIEVLNLKDNK